MTKLILSKVLLLSSLQEFSARVIRITDGDSIVVLTSDNQQIKIRLEGIDCPESKQDLGQKAKQATADLCVNNEPIRLGMAWHFKKYNSDPELSSLEVKARENKVGLWSQGEPVAPWEWSARK